MEETLEKNTILLQQESFLKVSPATEEEILAYLRRSQKIADIAVAAERETTILNLCEKLDRKSVV